MKVLVGRKYALQGRVVKVKRSVGGGDFVGNDENGTPVVFNERQCSELTESVAPVEDAEVAEESVVKVISEETSNTEST